MDKALQSITTFSLIGFVTLGCGGVGKEETGGTETISPNDADALSGVLEVLGAVVEEGELPAPTPSPDAPILDEWGGDPNVFTTGDPSGIAFSLNATPYAENVYLQVRGATSYFRVPSSAAVASSWSGDTHSGVLRMGLQVPVAVAAGAFDLDLCVTDTNDNVSNTVGVPCEVVKGR